MADETAAAEGRVVRFKGEEFGASFPVPPMALMEFASIAQGDVDSSDLAGLAAMFDLLESVIEPDDWDRFRKHAKKSRASDKDLMTLVRKVITGQTDRPTVRPSDSSDGPGKTESSSVDDSSSPVAEETEEWLRVKTRLEADGRPDKALMVLQAHEARSAA